ncbi:BTAD domain-containing putative transcriptional regulator [Actinoplanes sp. NEAU-A12]|uniref:BTAD domain-containing putative transcriptional regulator n=1 Tax=Actinoplanes sandaracinus TaxID=3045177 RepID=A0ABT6WQF7_9ACTN|nr:BTAD domain-containing putative transcriptional regulator [Actinoplanes sandaracinus]MDI6101963.1 BTAD domain-containing putative transcriptional regulator [Actinoplanes sandaracinus]
MTDESAASPLRFEILGVVRAFRDSRQLDLGPAKQRAVLAVLLLNPGRPVPTHRIVDAVWGDEPPENGTNVVQKYVAGLRRVLDPDRSPRTPGELLALTDGGYVLHVGSLDVDDFRAALARADTERRAGRHEDAAGTVRRALDLWHGEPLGGLTGPLFDAARDGLADEQAAAWEMWAEIGLARGGETGLVSELSRLIREYPLREGLRAQLMIALHQSGRQAEALAVFRDARAYFLEELGAEPGDRLQETHRRILRNEPFYTEPVDPWAGRQEPTPPPADPVSVQPYSPPPSSPAPYSPAPYSPATHSPIPHQAAAHQQAPYAAAPPHPPAWSGAGPLPGHLFAPRRQGVPWAEVVLAAMLPLVTCSLGSWLYFAYAAVQRRTRRDVIVAAGYFAMFVTMMFLMLIDPSNVEIEPLNPTEEAGIMIGFLLIPVAAVHGAVLAAHPGDNHRARARRELARQFAAINPGGARQAGIGRPDLLRSFDDGGLVDLNHAPVQEVARLQGISPIEAHRIVLDRYERGPYSSPAELPMRGLLPQRTVRRLSPWLICVPPEQMTLQPPAL